MFAGFFGVALAIVLASAFFQYIRSGSQGTAVTNSVVTGASSIVSTLYAG